MQCQHQIFPTPLTAEARSKAKLVAFDWLTCLDIYKNCKPGRYFINLLISELFLTINYVYRFHIEFYCGPGVAHFFKKWRWEFVDPLHLSNPYLKWPILRYGLSCSKSMAISSNINSGTDQRGASLFGQSYNFMSTWLVAISFSFPTPQFQINCVYVYWTCSRIAKLVYWR